MLVVIEIGGSGTLVAIESDPVLSYIALVNSLFTFGGGDQRDHIGRFVAGWATFESLVSVFLPEIEYF